MKIELTRYDETFLECSIEWFQNDELLKLIDASPISPSEQRKWFALLSDRTDYAIWGVLSDNRPIGALGLKHINYELNSAELFCYIGDKSMWGKGCGSKMLSLACQEARTRGLETLYLHVLNDNVRAKRLYEKNGFVVDSIGERLTTMSIVLK